MKHNYIIIILFLFAVNSMSQTNWVVPDDKKNLISPFKFDSEHKKAGEEIFKKYCISCHGHPGQNDHANIIPIPIDPASKKYQANSDGDLFYKITEGKTPMPTFKNILKSEEIWSVISYVRSFNKDYVQVTSNNLVNNNINKAFAKLFFSEKKHKLNVTISESDKNTMPINGIKVSVYVKRYFGWLQIDETKITNQDGMSIFEYPKKLPGDEKGNVKLKVNISNADGTEATLTDTTLTTSVVAIHNNILDNRAMWNIRSKAPIWLILSYSGTVLCTWGIIFYIFSLLLKIRKKGTE